MTGAVFVPSPRRHHSKASRNPFHSFSSRHTVSSSFSGPNLSALARETRRKIKWDQVLRGSGSQAGQWKWLENAPNFSIYTKRGTDNAGDFGVLSIGTINGTVPEVASLLTSTMQSEYEQKMTALHDKEFSQGRYITDVVDEFADEADDDANSEIATHLSVRSATFARSRWLKRDDEWTYLEATKYDKQQQRFEKYITTLKPDDVLPPAERKARKFGDAKTMRDVVSGYSVEPEDASEPTSVSSDVNVRAATVRVHYYAELQTPSSTRGFGRLTSLPHSINEASTKAIRQRLLRMAKDCNRLSMLVRRRRLGIQMLVDQRRVLPPTNSTCNNCDKVQLVGKLCRVCGQGVCGNCSDKYERETHLLRGKGSKSDAGRRVRLEKIRVCDPCLSRVETADYSHMQDAALLGPSVFPNALNKLGEATSAARDLKQLLNDALLDAPSQQRKSAVMSVIRCVLNQEKALTPPVTPAHVKSDSFGLRQFDGVMLTPLSADSEYVNALDCLDVETTPFDQVETADMDGRAYAVQPNADLAAPMPFPVPENEDKRATEVNSLDMLSGEVSDELTIICDIAAKEMDSFASIVTLITSDSQHVIAANVPALENMKMNREDSFCQHAVMSEKPLIVPNPESDVRFSRIMPVTQMGLKFYCGFPITSGDDNAVIGTLCCVDQKKHEMTEAQFAAMQRLAETASKVVKIQSTRRRTSSLNVTSASAAPPVPMAQ